MYWGVLLGVVVFGVVARLSAAKPLWVRRAVAVPTPVLVVAALAALGLVFHCAVMFFEPWVDVVPGVRGAGDTIRAMGPASRWAYAVPAATLVLVLRRVWWPALALLVAALTGVGVTMYGPFR